MKTLLLDLKISFLKQLASAVKYLHEQQFVHRDIKPDNILVHKEGDAYAIKLTDLGFARRFPATSGAVSATGAGTQDWQAPEILPGEDEHVRYDYGVDIYSLGLVFLSLAEHQPGHPLVAKKGKTKEMFDQKLENRDYLNLVILYFAVKHVEKKKSKYETLSSIVTFPVQGIPLGMWMWQRKLNKLPIKVPITVSAEDGAEEKTIKLLVQRMVCPDQSYRSSIGDVFGALAGKYIFHIYLLLIISYSRLL